MVRVPHPQARVRQDARPDPPVCLQAQGLSYQAFWVANVIAANGVDRSLVNTLAARADVNLIESNDPRTG